MKTIIDFLMTDVLQTMLPDDNHSF